MNSKLLKASLAGAAAIALAAGGSTFAAYSDFGTVNGNSVGAGILKLNLANGDNSAVHPIAFGDLAPGMGSRRADYVASSDGQSVPQADLYLTLSNVQDAENGCSSNSETVADPTCGAGGTPGELSQVLRLAVVSYEPPAAPGTCTSLADSGIPAASVINSAVITNETGALADPANLGTQFKLNNAPLPPGHGVCVAYFTFWDGAAPVFGTPPADNAAQGDSLTFDARYDLIQHV